MTMNKFAAVIGIVGVLALGGCETMNGPSSTTNPGAASSGSAYSGYGVVQSIDVVRQSNTGSTGIAGSGIGIGTVAGAVVGGVLGNQVGSGRGNTVATVAGAAGGAYVGNEIDKRQQQQGTDAYRFTVRMDNGAYQTLTQNSSSGFRVGDRVRIDNGLVQRY